MDSELVGTWKRTLEIQGFRRPAEYVPSAVASRSTEAEYCKDGWKDARQKNMKEKEKIIKEIIKTQTEDAVVLAKAIPAEEYAEDVEEAVDDAVEEETTVTI
jgi:propanediol dehydratase large subunit